jgi:hypothetical protein
MPGDGFLTYVYFPFPIREVHTAREYCAIAQRYLEQRDLHDAACVNLQGRRRFPEDFELLLQFAGLCQRYGQWGESRSCLEGLADSLRRTFPRSPEEEQRYCRVRLALAQLYRSWGTRPTASGCCRRSWLPLRASSLLGRSWRGCSVSPEAAAGRHAPMRMTNLRSRWHTPGSRTAREGG